MNILYNTLNDSCKYQQYTVVRSYSNDKTQWKGPHLGRHKMSDDELHRPGAQRGYGGAARDEHERGHHQEIWLVLTAQTQQAFKPVQRYIQLLDFES